MSDELIDYTDYDRMRKLVFDQAKQAAAEAFPISNERYTLTVSDLAYKGDEQVPIKKEKEAKLQGKSSARRLVGRWNITDNTTGKTVTTRPRTLMNVPRMTRQGTFIRDGTEYTISKQFRLRPGVYTRVTDDGRPEAQFNAQSRSGPSFRIFMDPDTSVFYMRHKTNKVPLYPVLKTMGVDDEEMQKTWGKAIHKANLAMGKKPHALNWISKLTAAANEGRPPEERESQQEALTRHFQSVKLDPEVTRYNLGTPYDAATIPAIMSASNQVLKVARREAEGNDRDSLQYQTVHDISDFLAEKIRNDQNGQARKILWKLTNKQGDPKAIPPSFMDKHVSHLFNNSGLAQGIEQISPLDPFDQNQRVSRLGEGAMSSVDVVPEDARDVQPSYLGYVDPIRAPESLKIGVDMRLARNVKKGKNNLLYTRFTDATGREKKWVDQQTAARSTVGFAQSRTSPDRFVPAIANGKLSYVDKKDIDFFLESPDDMFSYGANLTPFKSSDKAMRLLMGSKFGVSAVPLVEREAPLVRTTDPDHESTEKYLGKFLGALKADQDGVVKSVHKDHIKVRNADGTETRHDLYVNYPFARSTYIRSTPQVKAGARVRKGDVLASSNYTDDKGVAALGKNLRVAYATYHGKNFEDAVVVSESAAKKMTSEHMFEETLEKTEGVDVGKDRFFKMFPGRFSKEQLGKIDDKGMAKPGAVLHYGDPIMLAVKDRPPSPETAGRRLHSDNSITWQHHFPAKVASVVTDRVEGKDKNSVYIRANLPLEVGDKLALRHGGKGVISEIVPDKKMMHDSKGRPFDLLLAPEGLITRTNPGQLIETLMGKVAEKTGKPVTVPGFSDESAVEFAKRALKENNLKDTETIHDPTLKKDIPGVFTGKQYVYKMQQTAEKKSKSRATGKYTSEDQPAKGGKSGSKHLGDMELQALLGHGATNLIKDMKLIKGQRNDEFWRQIKLGYTPSMPEVPLVYEKFKDLVRAAGVDLQENDTGDNIFAMSNERVRELTGTNQIKSSKTYGAKDMKPIPGGLFDPVATGSQAKGDKWSYIELPEPMLNPVMYEPTRRLLGLKKKELDSILRGEQEYNGKRGGAALKELLKNVDLANIQRHAIHTIKSGAKTKRNDAMKQLQYATALKREGKQPEEFVWDRVPVLPPRFRPIVSTDKQILVADPNYLYKTLLDSIEDFQEVQQAGLPTEEQNTARAAMLDNLRALIGTGGPVQPALQNKNVQGILQQMLGKGSPKASMVQRRLIGTNIDLAGLSTIVPNPSLKLDEVGLPKKKAWELYKPFIIRHLVRKGVPATVAAKAVVEKTEQAEDALREVVKQRPVVINRAPSLHKYSVLAAWPRLTEGHTLQIPPAITGPMGADFDGDTMSYSVPVSDEAVADAKQKMLPSKLLLSERNEKVQFAPGQEYIKGLYLATKDPAEKVTKRFATAEEAFRAYRDGKISIDDPIVIEQE